MRQTPPFLWECCKIGILQHPLAVLLSYLPAVLSPYDLVVMSSCRLVVTLSLPSSCKALFPCFFKLQGLPMMGCAGKPLRQSNLTSLQNCLIPSPFSLVNDPLSFITCRLPIDGFRRLLLWCSLQPAFGRNREFKSADMAPTSSWHFQVCRNTLALIGAESHSRTSSLVPAAAPVALSPCRPPRRPASDSVRQHALLRSCQTLAGPLFSSRWRESRLF